MTYRLVALLCASAFSPFAASQSRGEENEDLRIGYLGKVTAMTEKTITIKPEGDFQVTAIKAIPGGGKTTRLYVQDNSAPPRKFVFNDTLLFRDGLLPPGSRAAPLAIGQPEGHKITDIRVGDLVEIGCREVKGIDYCIKIEIRRRPGGKVPPAQDEFVVAGIRNTHRLHDRMNAEQFIEETVLPELKAWRKVLGW